MNSLAVTYDVERLRSIPVSAVAEEFGTVVRKGSVHFTCCPWHEDRHPSLALYEKTGENHCHCFSCGKGGSTIDFVMAQLGCDFPTACAWLSNRFNVLTLNGKAPKVRYNSMPKKPVPPTVATVYIPYEWLKERVTTDNAFCRCLAHLVNPDTVERVTSEYLLGGFLNEESKINFVLFPAIDRHARIHNIKCQAYETDIHSPRFFHSTKGCSFWLGKQLQSQGVVSHDGETNTNCLFGEHLLDLRPLADVVLVESPKNAVLGSSVYPQYVWVAAGNRYMLKRSILEPLRGRKVMVYPDRDAIKEWRKTLDRMADLAYFTVSDFCERYAPADQPKYDIGDHIISQLAHGQKSPTDECPF